MEPGGPQTLAYNASYMLVMIHFEPGVSTFDKKINSILQFTKHSFLMLSEASQASVKLINLNIFDSLFKR